MVVADREGFEPSVGFHLHTRSRRAHFQALSSSELSDLCTCMCTLRRFLGIGWGHSLLLPAVRSPR